MIELLLRQGEMLEALVTDVGELKQGQAETNQRLYKLEGDVSVIKEDTGFIRRLVDEAFRDISMLDKRTQPLKKAK